MFFYLWPSPVRKPAAGYSSSSGHTPSPGLISPPRAPLLASPQTTPTFPAQLGRVGGGGMARVPGHVQQPQHLPGQNLFTQQQVSLFLNSAHQII